MFNKHPAQLERKSAWPIVSNTLIASMIATGILGWLVFYHRPPVGWFDDHAFTTTIPWLFELLKTSWDRTVASQSLFQYFKDPLAGFHVFTQNIDRFDLITPISWRLAMVGTGALFVALVVGTQTYIRLDGVDRLKHIRGRQLLKGRKAVHAATSPA